jgi:hypothetical protein
MGSYLGTCMVSQLTISGRTPCRLVFIKKLDGRYGSTSGSNVCGIDLFWKPISLPILGVYEDRGEIEKWDPNDWRVQDMLAKLEGSLIERPEKDDRGCDPIVRPASIDMAAIQRHILERQDDVQIANWNWQKAESGEQLGFVLIREDVYQGLIATPFEDYRGESVDVKARATEMLDWFDKLCTAIDEADRTGVSWVYDAMRTVEHEYHPAWGGTSGQALESFKHAFKQRLTDAVREGDAAYKAFKTLGRARCYALAEFLYFHEHLQNLRKQWMPQAGGGAQDDGHQSAKALARIVQMSVTKTDLGDEEDSQPFHDLFFSKFVPPQAFQVGREERMKFAEVIDTDDVAFLVDAKAVGDGDGYGSLFVVKNEGDTYDYYVVSYENKTVEKYSHDKSLGGYYGQAMYEIPAGLWPER